MKNQVYQTLLPYASHSKGRIVTGTRIFSHEFFSTSGFVYEISSTLGFQNQVALKNTNGIQAKRL